MEMMIVHNESFGPQIAIVKVLKIINYLEKEKFKKKYFFLILVVSLSQDLSDDKSFTHIIM